MRIYLNEIKDVLGAFGIEFKHRFSDFDNIQFEKIFIVRSSNYEYSVMFECCFCFGEFSVIELSEDSFPFIECKLCAKNSTLKNIYLKQYIEGTVL